MIKVSILYPNEKHARFDLPYYLTTHMLMSIERMSASTGFQGVSVERGIGGDAPGSAPTYIAMCHYLFDSFEDFLAAFNRYAELLQGDMAMYTDIKPVIQVNQVEIIR